MKEDARNKEKRSIRHDVSSPGTDHMISKATRYNIYITESEHWKHYTISISKTNKKM